MRYQVSFAALFIMFCSGLRAEEPTPIELTIHARALETPVLKYRLLPAEADLKPGNAVPILLRLPWEQVFWMHDFYPTLKDWDSRPLDAPEWAAAQDGVLPLNFFNQMKHAAFRRDAAWEYPIGETSSLYMILLPDAQGLRSFLGYGLSARIRWHLARGELHQALEGIMVGLANARHLAQTPFYVSQFIALAIDRAMLDRIAELISQPNSPNLYWALSFLPNSLIELDRAASLESTGFAMTFPAVNDFSRPREVWEWKKMGEQLIEVLQQFCNGAPASVVQWVEVARSELPKMLAITQEKLAAMSDEEASIRWYVLQRLALDQRVAATLVLAPREAWPMLHHVRKDMASMQEKTGTKETFKPTALYVSAWSLRRKVQSLRVIEAVRHHLATHDGKLPQTLAEIRGIPVPVDPMTDQPFHWHVDGKSAVLKAPSLAAEVIEPDWETVRANALEYRLEVK